MAVGWAKNAVAQVEEKIRALTSKARIVLVVLLAIMVIGGSVVAYLMYDFTQNSPKFCVTCHLMQPAFDSWAISGHKGLNCHDCHHLSLAEQNMLLVSFVVKRPDSVPARHGKVIVSSSFCIECHIKGSEKRGKAPMIKDSRFHAKHVEKDIACSQCHGQVGPDNQGVHRFLPTEKFCSKCHENREVHGVGMGELACLNCHTDRTENLKPGRRKCLFCHSSDDSIRKLLVEDGTIDVKYFTPGPDIIKKATKITFKETSPMQINCYECHKPHTKGKVRPNSEVCLNCHADVSKIGKHETHLALDMQCKACHKPHLWKVTEASAKKDCVKCHEYRTPGKFMLQ